MQIKFSHSLILFSFLIAATTNAAAQKSKDYIVGGQDVGAFDPVAKATVGIFDPSPDGHSGALCTGTLISKDIALTAAHCVPPGAARPVVIFGNDLHSPDSVHRAADAVAVNPKWKTQAGQGMDQGDIALVKFKGGLPQGYGKVPTVTSDKDIQNGEAVTLAGYGINNSRTKAGAGILRKTQVSVLNSREGKSEMILDQSHGHGACHGDSGGPAFVNQGGKIALAGLTNRSYPDSAPDDCRHQVVYTKVPAYKSWIQKSEKKMENSDTESSSGAPILAKSDASQRMLSRKTIMSTRHRNSPTRSAIHVAHAKPSRSQIGRDTRQAKIEHDVYGKGRYPRRQARGLNAARSTASHSVVTHVARASVARSRMATQRPRVTMHRAHVAAPRNHLAMRNKWSV